MKATWSEKWRPVTKNTAKRHIRPLYMWLFFMCFSRLWIIGWWGLYFFVQVIFNYRVWSCLYFCEVVFIYWVRLSSFFWWCSLNFLVRSSSIFRWCRLHFWKVKQNSFIDGEDIGCARQLFVCMHIHWIN